MGTGKVSHLQGWLTPFMTAHWLLLIVLIPVSIHDMRRREIPNVFLFAIALLGFFTTSTGWNRQTWAESFGGFAVGLLLSFTVYVFGGIGGGDVKVLSAMGLVLGWRAELGVIFYVAIFGGIGAAIARWRKREEYPYGPAIALGLLAYIVRGYLPRSW